MLAGEPAGGTGWVAWPWSIFTHGNLTEVAVMGYSVEERLHLCRSSLRTSHHSFHTPMLNGSRWSKASGPFLSMPVRERSFRAARETPR